MSKTEQNSLYRYTRHENLKHRDEVITHSQIWFSQPDSFNDPLDCKLDYRQDYSEEEIHSFWSELLKLKPSAFPSLSETLRRWGRNEEFVTQQNNVFEKFRKNIGVACFSETPKNILMWSHYANNHKGILYEFSPDLFLDSASGSFLGKPMKVDYAQNNEYNLLSYVLTGENKQNQFVTEQLTKANDWEYEQEYRFIDLKNSGNKQFKKESLKSVIFGAKTPKKEMDRFKQLCEDHGFSHVQFKQANFIKGKFEIEIIRI